MIETHRQVGVVTSIPHPNQGGMNRSLHLMSSQVEPFALFSSACFFTNSFSTPEEEPLYPPPPPPTVFL